MAFSEALADSHCLGLGAWTVTQPTLLMAPAPLLMTNFGVKKLDSSALMGQLFSQI